MKNYILIICIFFNLNLFAQEESNNNEKITKETIYNDGKEVVKTTYEDIKSLTPEIEDALKTLSKKFNTSINGLWGILVKQQKVYSFGYLCLFLASMFNWFLFYKNKDEFSKPREVIKLKIPVQKLLYDEGEKERDTVEFSSLYGRKYRTIEEEKIVMKPVDYFKIPIKELHFIFCIILTIGNIYFFQDMLTGFINPEYGALKTIVETSNSILNQ